MSSDLETKSYLTLAELCDRTGLSPATIGRLKKAGKIPFFQPAGKRGRVLFPRDAIELLGAANGQSPVKSTEQPKPLSGPKPKWEQRRDNPIKE